MHGLDKGAVRCNDAPILKNDPENIIADLLVYNIWARVLVHPGSKHRERLSISSENLFRNRCKISKFKPTSTY